MYKNRLQTCFRSLVSSLPICDSKSPGTMWYLQHTPYCNQHMHNSCCIASHVSICYWFRYRELPDIPPPPSMLDWSDIIMNKISIGMGLTHTYFVSRCAAYDGHKMSISLTLCHWHTTQHAMPIIVLPEHKQLYWVELCVPGFKNCSWSSMPLLIDSTRHDAHTYACHWWAHGWTPRHLEVNASTWAAATANEYTYEHTSICLGKADYCTKPRYH
jgi:hypothetical protein